LKLIEIEIEIDIDIDICNIESRNKTAV